MTGDGAVDPSDLDFLINTLFGTSIGDADLDGVFNSRDLVVVLQAGEYEDGVAGNSTWSEGDWNCDGEFDSGDVVRAFIAGDYTAAASQALSNALSLPTRVGAAAIRLGTESNANSPVADRDELREADVAELPLTDRVRRENAQQARDLVFSDPADSWQPATVDDSGAKDFDAITEGLENLRLS